MFGAYLAGFLNDLFGISSFLWPLIFGFIGVASISASLSMRWGRWCGFFLLTICLMVFCSAWDLSIGDLSGGGMIGSTLALNSSHYLSPFGSALLWIFILIVAFQLLSNFSLFAFAEKKFNAVRLRFCNHVSMSADTAAKDEGRPSIGVSILAKLPGIANMPDFIMTLFRKNNSAPVKSIFHHDNLPTTSDIPIVISTKDPNKDISSSEIESPSEVASHDIEHSENPDTGPVISSVADNIFSLGQNLVQKLADSNRKSKISSEHPISTVPTPVLSNIRKKAKIPLPPIDILAMPQKSSVQKADIDSLKEKGKTLITCLADFDIQGELVRITPGPVVTMYEVRPAPGIRVNRIAGLGDDLALALKAISVRIQGHIPGSDTVGIEIPNDRRETVNFRELAISDDFRRGCGPLTMILGKDISGKPYMADLTKMPHLLVAGATGAGKSVCLNSILVSMLYKLQPKDLQLLLIDPKKIELAMYSDEPHLVHPVVTDMNDAKNALDWAVQEMQNRYDAMEKVGARNLAGYNQKLLTIKNSSTDAECLEPLPYLVIVIDELADLMMTAAREVQTSIVRLAQLARAAGIHMILATQRPSVDVVTGLIKANFPCRISFQVTSKHDSRTILDQGGAEYLLGKGDMLFKPSGGKLMRLHGPFLSDDEVQGVVAHWKHHLTPTFEVDFSQWGAERAFSPGNKQNGPHNDEIYEKAKEFVLQHKKASTSLLQRQLGIGFNRAAKIMDQMENEGIIGPANGSKPRIVMR